MAALYLICGKIASVRNLLSQEQLHTFIEELSSLPKVIETALQLEPTLKEVSSMLSETSDCFFLGRGLDYPLACEGSLKLKEISYIHSEAYVAGELKHGPIALITDQVPVVAIVTNTITVPKMISNIREVKARGSKILVITDQDMSAYPDVADALIELPKTDELFTPFTISVAVQFLSYYVSLHRGLDVDQPRNLAKSVTVE